MSVLDFLLEKRSKRRYGAKAPSGSQLRKSFKTAQQGLLGLATALNAAGKDSSAIDDLSGRLRAAERDAGLKD